MMLNQRQTGFTLVELMVAMAIGTVIILGAGQLFLTTFQTFKKVDELSRKQEAVVFATTVLANDYRKSENKRDYTYILSKTTDNPEECSIRARRNGGSPQPIIGGLAPYKDEGECDTGRFVSLAKGLDGEDLDGFYHFTFDFKRGDGLETLSFHVMERKF
ncbi:prepilin-type N-terminal cleavage/methylation domain-containing protein [Halomonas sp. M1]|uniref:PilW family protein n=1 Tax=Halomonas sp. M1 TaxID=3035470 RepID=UPI0024856A56|nr:prepilin-type N-terminal cleavage/methylation domain-containing protein [Halomonas sp. M1]WFE70778.1 prepilin-type N-terminal cleavage/methylation domain-containing protein [Halomonas sp. M1]